MTMGGIATAAGTAYTNAVLSGYIWVGSWSPGLALWASSAAGVAILADTLISTVAGINAGMESGSVREGVGTGLFTFFSAGSWIGAVGRNPFKAPACGPGGPCFVAGTPER